MSRIPAQERHSDAQSGQVRVPWLTYYRDQAAAVASATQIVPDGVVRAEGQTAAIATTAIPTGTLVAGLYRVNWFGVVITAAGVTSSFQVTVTWTNNGVTQTVTGALQNGNLTTTYESAGPALIHLDSGTPVSYAVAYASNPAAAMVYDFYLTLQLVQAD
jgi:hypothetical protein